MKPGAIDPVIHLELHTRDLRGAIQFYERLCGWQPKRIHAGRGSYTALEMGNGIGGGVVECPGPRSLWLPYVHVGDVAETTERASALGAEVLLAPRDGPKGSRSVVAAPDGAEVAFWQPKSERAALSASAGRAPRRSQWQG